MKKILSIAGSDCSGGAGIQADIKTITAHKMYAMSVITSLTAQNTTGVFGVCDTSADFVIAQINAVCSDIIPDATKIGMLSNADIMKAVSKSIQKWQLKNVILDPVMVASSGGILMQQNAINSLKSELLPLADLVTPNLLEAEILSQKKIANLDDMKIAALKIANLGAKAVLIKGGHLEQNALDLLYFDGEFFEFTSPKIATKNNHGTGCTLSSAIACALGANLDMKNAVRHAKDFVFKALSWNKQIGHGSGAIDHYFAIKSPF